VKPLDDKLTEKSGTMTGSFLMHHGLNLTLGGDFDATSVVFEKIK